MMNEFFETNTHLRYNILTGKYVLCSPNRNKRPWQGKLEKVDENSLISQNLKQYDENCYLCPNNKRNNGTINKNYKKTYTFVNDFAALKPKTILKAYQNKLLKTKTEKGICKVICYSPNHSLTISNMKPIEIEEIIKTWINEYHTLSKLKHINYIQIFENKGEIMGCSNKHPHGQIWANNTIPDVVKLKNKHQKKYYKKHNEVLLLAYLKHELQLHKRILFENEDFVWLVPFWAVWPFETMIIPKKHQQSVLNITENQINNFAKILLIANKTYNALFKIDFPYSAGFHQKPTKAKNYEHWQWHFSFYPPLLRSATIKKFMVGYEMFATPQRDFTPEFAAEKLKDVLQKEW